MGIVIDSTPYQRSAAQPSAATEAYAKSPESELEPATPLTFPYPVVSRIVKAIDEFFDQDPTTFIPAPMTFAMVAHPIFTKVGLEGVLRIEGLVARLRYWFHIQTQSIPHALDQPALQALKEEVAAVAKVPIDELAKNPTDVLAAGLKTINAMPAEAGAIVVDVPGTVPGTVCPTLCAVNSTFTRENIEVTVRRMGPYREPQGPPIRTIPLRYDVFQGNPTRRVIKAKNITERKEPGTASPRTRLRQKQRGFNRKQESERREQQARNPAPSRDAQRSEQNAIESRKPDTPPQSDARPTSDALPKPPLP